MDEPMVVGWTQRKLAIELFDLRIESMSRIHWVPLPSLNASRWFSIPIGGSSLAALGDLGAEQQALTLSKNTARKEQILHELEGVYQIICHPEHENEGPFWSDKRNTIFWFSIYQWPTADRGSARTMPPHPNGLIDRSIDQLAFDQSSNYLENNCPESETGLSQRQNYVN
jgi:hypothetical protein